MEMYLFTTYRGIGLTLTNHPKNDFFPGRREPLKFSGNKRAVGHLDPVIDYFCNCRNASLLEQMRMT